MFLPLGKSCRYPRNGRPRRPSTLSPVHSLVAKSGTLPQPQPRLQGLHVVVKLRHIRLPVSDPAVGPLVEVGDILTHLRQCGSGHRDPARPSRVSCLWAGQLPQAG
jgi:hypothetical protein